MPRSRFTIVLVAAGVACFANSLSGVFLFDDFASIHQNPSIRSLWPPWVPLLPPGGGATVSGRPLSNLSLALNFAAGGLDVRGYHVINIALHLICALLVMGIVRLGLSRPEFGARVNRSSRHIAFVCALLWMLHPLQSEVADYIVARTESLMAACALLSIYAAMRVHVWEPSTRNRSTWTAVSIAACALGMACKESMVVTPVLIVLIDRALFFPSFVEAVRKRRVLYGGLAATWIVLAVLVAASPRANSAGFAVRADAAAETTLQGYVLNQALIVPHYLKLVAWPSDLVLDYGQAKPLRFEDVWPQASAMIALGVVAILAWYRNPLWGLPLAWLFVTLAPTSLVPIVSEVGAERRMYLASAGLITAIVVSAWCAGLRGRAAIAVMVIMAAALSIATVQRNTEYDSPYVMWRTVVERRPHGRAYLNLAVEAEAAGRQAEVLPLLRSAVADFPDAEYPLGARLYQARAYDEAIVHLGTFLQLRAGHYQADAARTLLIQSWTDLGIARAQRGERTGAIQAFTEAVRLDQANADLHRNLANALLENGQGNEAIAHAMMVLAARPGDAAALDIVREARRMQVQPEGAQP